MFFFFNDTATTEIYTLSLHDALPISDEVEEDQCELDRCHAHAEDYEHRAQRVDDGADLGRQGIQDCASLAGQDLRGDGPVDSQHEEAIQKHGGKIGRAHV